MKRLLLFGVAAVGLMQISFAQYERLVLFEEFTQASCGPCASQNPGFNTLLQDNLDKAASIKYQVWWPGFDPMYLQNTPDVDARVSYYGVSGVPHATMDGTNVTNDCGYYEAAPACVSQDDIDNAYAITSPFLMNVTHSFSADYKTIYVHVDVTAGVDVTGSLKLHVVVAEKEINFETPPGSNGELDFYGVMKKMLPNSSGTVTGDFSAGETKSYDLSWDLANVYDLNQIEVVAFMQEDGSHDVKQAAISEPIGGLPDIDYALNSVSAITCSNTFTPAVSVTNNDVNAVSALDFEYTIDGGAPATYNWTGSIAAGATASISLPEVTLAGAGSHSISVNMQSPDAVDVNLVNNAMGSGISMLDVAQINVEEGFVDPSFPPTNWALDNLNDGTGWVRVANEGGYGESNNSAKADFFNISVGTFDLYLPKTDLSAYTGAVTLSFDRAYAQYNTSFIDALRISVSEDCGTTWDEVYYKESSDLSTAPNTTSSFRPDDDEWATDEIDLTSYAGNGEVIVKFSAISGYGNNLYIDNIRLNSPVSVTDLHLIRQFDLYPNPASTMANASFQLIEGGDVTLQVVDATGRVIDAFDAGAMNSGAHEVSLNTTNYAAGMYQVVIRVNDIATGVENLVVIK